MQQQPHHQHHHMPSSQQGKFGLDEGRLLGGPGEGAGSMSVTGTGDGTGTGMGSNIYNRASGPSVHPGTGYHRPSGSSIGGSFSGGMPAGFPGGGGGSSGLAAMLAAQQGFGFSGPGLGPRGHLDQGGHGSQPGSFARVSGPQPVQGIVNPFAAANRGGGGGTGVGSGSMPSGSGSGASMMNAALGIGGSSGAQFNSRGGSGFPGSGSMEMASGWGGGGGGGWGSAAFGATPLPAGSEFAQQAFYQQLMEASQAAQARQLMSGLDSGLPPGGPPGDIYRRDSRAAALRPAQQHMIAEGQRGSGSLVAPSMDEWVQEQARQRGEHGSAPPAAASPARGEPAPSDVSPMGAEDDSGLFAGSRGSKRPRSRSRKRKSASEGSDGGEGEAGPGPAKGGRGRGGPRKDYAALDEKVQRRLAQNREAARKSRQRKKDYMKQLEVELNEKLKRGEVDEVTAAAAAALVRAPSTRSGSSTMARPTMSALQQSLRELNSVGSIGAGSSTLTRNLLANLLPTAAAAAVGGPASTFVAQGAAAAEAAKTKGGAEQQPPLMIPPPQPTSDAEATAGATFAGGGSGSGSGATAPGGRAATSEAPTSQPLISEASFRFASVSSEGVVPTSAPLGMAMFGALVPAAQAGSSDGSQFGRPLGAGALQQTLSGDDQVGSAMTGGGLGGGGASRTHSIASLHLPGTVAARAQAPLNAEIHAALQKWREDHMRTALAVRRALDATSGPDADDAELRRLVSTAQTDLWSYFQLKRAILSGESAGIIINNEHLLPAEQPFAWLGAQRPSEAVAGLLVKLGAQVVQPALGRLRTLQASLGEQERVTGAGYADLLAGLRQRAATLPASAAGVEEGLSPTSSGSGFAALQAAWGGSEVPGRLDAMRSLLTQPDRLWEQFLTEAGRVLPLRQYAVAVICWAETSLQHQSLHLPWLASMHQHQGAAGGATPRSAARAAAQPWTAVLAAAAAAPPPVHQFPAPGGAFARRSAGGGFSTLSGGYTSGGGGGAVGSMAAPPPRYTGTAPPSGRSSLGPQAQQSPSPELREPSAVDAAAKAQAKAQEAPTAGQRGAGSAPDAPAPSAAAVLGSPAGSPKSAGAAGGSDRSDPPLARPAAVRGGALIGSAGEVQRLPAGASPATSPVTRSAAPSPVVSGSPPPAAPSAAHSTATVSPPVSASPSPAPPSSSARPSPAASPAPSSAPASPKATSPKLPSPKELPQLKQSPPLSSKAQAVVDFKKEEAAEDAPASSTK